MTIPYLCELLKLPLVVSDAVRDYVDSRTSVLDEELQTRLLQRESWEQAVEELKQRIGDDPYGFYILAEMLSAACHTYEAYQRMGIEDDVFIETMKFCTRFTEEHKKKYGEYAFEWAWWFVRQLAMQEFRLGELEYEFVDGDERKIYIHIPSGARMVPECIQESFAAYKCFLEKYYPEWKDVNRYCNSWMMSPVLGQLLTEGSNVLAFQRLFEIVSVDYESMAVLDWVYPGEKADFASLSENTSLQRNMKRFLLNGGKVGWAEGRLL